MSEEEKKPESKQGPQQSDSAVDRWNKQVDWDRLEREDELRWGRRKKVWAIVAAVVFLLIVLRLVSCGGQQTPPPAAPVPPAQVKKPTPKPAEKAPTLPTDPEEIKKLLSNPTNPVVLITTDKGDMLVELFEDKVPNTVANMIALAEDGFYKDMSFHRIIPGFMAQGGCPHSKKGASGRPGTGGPGYKFADEFDPDLKHTGKGILSMANSGPNTNGSQFFLCFKDTPHLDGKHSVFGKVVAGMEVLKKLERIGTRSGKPKSTVRFDIEVVQKQDHPYQVRKL